MGQRSAHGSKNHSVRVHVLVVDDRPDNLLAISSALDRLGEDIVTASSGPEALRHVLRRTFAVILLQIDMPGMDGFETAQLIRQYGPARCTPIIFLTAAGDDAQLRRSYALGAVDYLVTPAVPEVLRGKVRAFADLHRETAEVERRATALAEQAKQLADELLATVSHELRSPLHALLGWTRLLRTGAPDPARTARGLEVIERNIRLQTSLIDELLDVSRIAAGRLQIEVHPVDLAPLIEGVVDALRPAADTKGVDLQTVIGEGLRIHGDAQRLQQVVSNLLGNALKFTEKGGRIDVVVGRWGSDVEVQVSDTGVGIRPEFLPFVFDRFRQADSSITRAHGGLGLGLSIVQHLVGLHGGSVRAESPGPGQGSTFVVRFPALGDAAAVSEVTPSAVTPRRGGGADAEAVPASGIHTLDGLRVLIVDDDGDARELLREVLQQRRAHVTTASSAREALDALGAHRPHVLVSDVAMKGEDGYDLIRRVRVRHPREGGCIPALALTAHARDEDRLRALDAGFQMHATKPIEPVELVAAVAALAGTALEPE